MSSSLQSNRQSLNRKVAVMGYPHVGKSALVLRFTQNIFPERYESTIEDQHSKHIAAFHRDYHLRVTDTAGQQEYTVFPRSCSLDINGFILVYAIDDRKSFEMCSNIYEKIVRTYGDTSIPIVIVGNKTDLSTQRVVRAEEGEELARQWDAKFVEITARESNRVHEVFELLLREIEISRGNLSPTERPNGNSPKRNPFKDDGKPCSIS
ncbi:GTP-binding protein Rheb homolog 1 [Caenorhabditis elegans]|uniref:GTP-binding protein Rheb homolog 1 n=1 Tax=Caenorhabditis elegans TaxID=6239 RepID=RHEB1_CAEEL|nr:GTP-binding protein Rheb homolog 1 [Caenorhabditis elegans]P34443.1 RecName: Full=GTP-binding protein Rheb homolog 1; Flags: Precursor [Caenorhabditis elegans]CAA80155.1 GTP-binding protein Rheb homolog 1 [Caenorhabditis elegans]|eukprot:NP_499079.1 GTP-binding protein Rheb homolog 1 [Caenorhabditis elegans]